MFTICHPWFVFKMIELTENMRQKDDKRFTELLNRIRTASQIKLRVIFNLYSQGW